MTAVDPRTIAANAARWMLDHGWYAYRDGSAYTFVAPDRERITVDHHGIHHTAAGTIIDTGGTRPTWSDMARAVDILAAHALLPYKLQTGWQEAGAYWRRELAKVQEAKALLDQQLRQAIADRDLVATNHAKVVGEYRDQLAELEQQLATARGHRADDVVVQLPEIGAAA